MIIVLSLSFLLSLTSFHVFFSLTISHYFLLSPGNSSYSSAPLRDRARQQVRKIPENWKIKSCYWKVEIWHGGCWLRNNPSLVRLKRVYFAPYVRGYNSNGWLYCILVLFIQHNCIHSQTIRNCVRCSMNNSISHSLSPEIEIQGL